MWDNRDSKRNPKAPDFKCKKKECGEAVWVKEHNTEEAPMAAPAATAPTQRKLSVLEIQHQVIRWHVEHTVPLIERDGDIAGMLARLANTAVIAYNDGHKVFPPKAPPPPPAPPPPVAPSPNTKVKPATYEDDDDLPF